MCCGDALKSCITTPFIIISNIVSLGLFVAIFATPEWYLLNGQFTNQPLTVLSSTQLGNFTIDEQQGNMYSCRKYGGQSIQNDKWDCFTTFHSIELLNELCYTYNNSRSNADIAACVSNEVSHYLLYLAFLLWALSFVLSFLSCCIKCATCGCCGNSCSCLAAIPAFLCFLSMAICVIIALANIDPYTTFLRNSNTVFRGGVVTVTLGLSFIFGAIEVGVLILLSCCLTFDGKGSSSSGDDYHAL